jgi:hypothetical protein
VAELPLYTFLERDPGLAGGGALAQGQVAARREHVPQRRDELGRGLPPPVPQASRTSSSWSVMGFLSSRELIQFTVV